MDLVEQLNHIFHPRSIAVVGASDNPEKFGSLCVANLLKAGFGGRIYPVNPGLSELFGLKTYPSVGTIPDEVDLAIIAIPAELTVPAVEECVAKGIKGAIMFTSGFRELGTGLGLDLQDRIRDIADRGGMKIIGPNCLGLVNPRANLHASFEPSFLPSKAGSVSIAAQSGGVCVYIAHTLAVSNVGISKAISLGNRCNLDFDEILTYFAEDKETKVIVMYIEGLENPRKLMSVASQVVKRKPILVIKGGRTEELNGVTLSHTGALAGNYGLYQSAFTQAGIIAVDDITELVDRAKALALQTPPAGNRVALLSATAGLSLVMADRCHKEGLKLAKFSPETWQRLRELISPLNSVDNPVDMSWAVHDAEISHGVLDIIMRDDNVDAVSASVGGASNAAGFARAAIDATSKYKKPITVCLGPYSVAAVEITNLFEENHIPTYLLPERAVTGLSALVKYGKILRRG